LFDYNVDNIQILHIIEESKVGFKIKANGVKIVGDAIEKEINKKIDQEEKEIYLKLKAKFEGVKTE